MKMLYLKKINYLALKQKTKKEYKINKKALGTAQTHFIFY